MTETFKEPESVRLSCDVHGWMQGWLIVEDNPYYAVTDEKGAFKLTDVPPGDYEVKVWQEKLGEATQKVTVKPGADTDRELRAGRQVSRRGSRSQTSVTDGAHVALATGGRLDLRAADRLALLSDLLDHRRSRSCCVAGHAASSS